MIFRKWGKLFVLWTGWAGAGFWGILGPFSPFVVFCAGCETPGIGPCAAGVIALLRRRIRRDRFDPGRSSISNGGGAAGRPAERRFAESEFSLSFLGIFLLYYDQFTYSLMYILNPG